MSQRECARQDRNAGSAAFELTNIFRYDDEGRLAEEWVQRDNRSALRQMGSAG